MNAPDMRGRFTTAADVRTFLLAGNSTLTVLSLRTRTRFTYRVRKAKGGTGDAWFVGVLGRHDDEGSYAYMGRLGAATYTHGRRNPEPGDVPFDDPAAVAFRWFHTMVFVGDNIAPNMMEIWHEGRCGRCGRKLTVPESIASGMGPECSGRKRGGASRRKKDRDQFVASFV